MGRWKIIDFLIIEKKLLLLPNFSQTNNSKIKHYANSCYRRYTRCFTRFGAGA